MYRMIAIDVDDTLFNDDRMVSDATKLALIEAVKKGVIVTLATGRMYASTKQIAELLPTPFGLVRAGVAPGPSEDQVGHADVREDRAQGRLPLLRRRAGRRGHQARGAARALPRGALRGRHRVGQPARDPRRGPAGLVPGDTVRRLVQRAPARLRRRVRPVGDARGRGRQRQRGDRHRPDAGARPRRAGADRHADHALAGLAAAQVEEVVILGRRGPAQAAFTNPELRELGELTRAAPIIDPAELELDEHSRRWLETEADPTHKRNFELLKDYSELPVGDKSHRITLRFLGSPVELIGEGEDGKVEAMRIVRNRIEPGADGALRAVATDVEEVIPCGLVIRSIGYRGTPLEDVPFDVRRGLIRNAGGRVCDEDGTPVARRVRRRLDQARPERRDRDEQEGRRRHGGADRRGRRGRTAGRAGGAGRRGDRGVAARQRPRRGRVGRLAGDRRARARARRVAGPPAREARARAPARRRGPRHAGRALRGCGQAATASAARAARRPTASRRP